MLIDTHCHLDFPDFAPEQADVVARAHAAGVGRMITISTHVTKFPAIAAISERYEEVFCTVGTHPNHALDEAETNPEELVALSRHPKCVAFGEAGLDYHYNHAKGYGGAGVPQSYRRRAHRRAATGDPHARR